MTIKQQIKQQEEMNYAINSLCNNYSCKTDLDSWLVEAKYENYCDSQERITYYRNEIEDLEKELSFKSERIYDLECQINELEQILSDISK